jgi:hypothetical protein
MPKIMVKIMPKIMVKNVPKIIQKSTEKPYHQRRRQNSLAEPPHF